MTRRRSRWSASFERSMAFEDLLALGDYGASILEYRCWLYCDGRHEVQFGGPALRALGSRRTCDACHPVVP